MFGVWLALFGSSSTFNHLNSVWPSVDLLQMLEMNMTIAFPAAPLLTVILALVGKLKFKMLIDPSHFES